LVATTLAHFKQIALDYGVPVEQIMVLATEAMRKAANAGPMLDAIKEAASGLTVSILEGTVETLCGAVMGSRSGVVNVDGGALFLDLGGGSVQMTWVDTTLPDYEFVAAKAGKSLPYGAARLMKILGDKTPEGEVAREKDLNDLQTGVLGIYDNLCGQFPALAAIRKAYEGGDKKAKVNVYMCGGGFRGYGSMLMHNDATHPYPIASTNTYTAPGKLFKNVEEMRKVNEKEKGRIFGMSKRRREQFPAIATVIESFIKAVPNIGDVTFCGGSNKQGALMMKLPFELRESNPLDVLAVPSASEKPVLEAVLQLIQQSIPQDVDFSKTPTIFTEGLGPLFVKDIWSRSGYDGDSNTAFALNDAILRDPEAPGLTHLGRSILALTASARWAGNLGPLDAKLFEGVTSIVQNKSDDAPFWAGYIGAVANIIAAIIPAFPKSAQELTKAIRQVTLIEPLWSRIALTVT
jgi:retrograde regulation protein 2